MWTRQLYTAIMVHIDNRRKSISRPKGRQVEEHVYGPKGKNQKSKGLSSCERGSDDAREIHQGGRLHAHWILGRMCSGHNSRAIANSGIPFQWKDEQSNLYHDHSLYGWHNIFYARRSRRFGDSQRKPNRWNDQYCSGLGFFFVAAFLFRWGKRENEKLLPRCSLAYPTHSLTADLHFFSPSLIPGDPKAYSAEIVCPLLRQKIPGLEAYWHSWRRAQVQGAPIQCQLAHSKGFHRGQGICKGFRRPPIHLRIRQDLDSRKSKERKQNRCRLSPKPDTVRNATMLPFSFSFFLNLVCICLLNLFFKKK